MNNIRFLTAGESHGQALSVIIDGIPSGLEICEDDIAVELRRRQRGYGRGGRMKIEQDRAKILSGVRYGKTLGSPIFLMLENKDWPNWTEKMSVSPVINPVDPLQMPRPGHADFAGMVKYRHDDLRNLLERSSARETAMRVAAGAVAKKLLSEFAIQVFGHVIQVGKVKSSVSAIEIASQTKNKNSFIENWIKIRNEIEKSPMACADKQATDKMIELVDKVKEKGDSLGGKFQLIVAGLPIGLGSHVQWDRKLDAQIAMALMSINAMKAVEIGLGNGVAENPGSVVHDQIFYDKKLGYYRSSNNAGGIEGGMTNGEPLVVSVSMKPLPTLSQPLHSVDVSSHKPKDAHYERADVCAVPAAVVVGEAMIALVIANAFSEKIGGDSIAEMKNHFKDLPSAPLGW